MIKKGDLIVLAKHDLVMLVETFANEQQYPMLEGGVTSYARFLTHDALDLVWTHAHVPYVEKDTFILASIGEKFIHLEDCQTFTYEIVNICFTCIQAQNTSIKKASPIVNFDFEKKRL